MLNKLWNMVCYYAALVAILVFGAAYVLGVFIIKAFIRPIFKFTCVGSRKAVQWIDNL